jgi:hypothetical protein
MKPKPFLLTLAILVLFACSGPLNVVINTGGQGPTAVPAITEVNSPAVAATNQPAATAPAQSAATETAVAPPSTDTPLPSNPQPTAASGTTTSVDAGASNYIDDRSTPSQLIVSYFNAINRREYSRAYGYYRDPAGTLGSFSAFSAGYGSTASVALVFGEISGDQAMSQLHYTVPVVLKVTSTGGTRTNFAACYLLRASVADVFGAPPFVPMGIDRGSASPSNVNADDASVLANACSGYPAGSYSVPVAGNPISVDSTNFLDDRSGPLETVNSLLNALNRRQYVRAYSYFSNAASYPGDYSSYAGGFGNTDQIAPTFGTVQSQGAAGSLYYKVPLGMTVATTTHSTQYFVGCFTLRLAQPGVQVTPPFQPMGITAGKFKLVNSASQLSIQLPAACN